MYLYTLRNFLQDPRKGGGPADLRVVKNWKEFVRRHTETFIYDAPSKMLRLRDLSVKIDPHVEARVVERLMPKLQSGPFQAAPGYTKEYRGKNCSSENRSVYKFHRDFYNISTYFFCKPGCAPCFFKLFALTF